MPVKLHGKPHVRSAAERKWGFASYICQFSKIVIISSGRDARRCAHAQAESLLCLRIATPMVQQNLLVRFEDEIGLPFGKKKHIFLDLFLVTFFLFLGNLCGVIWHAFCTSLEFGCSTSFFNGF